MLRSRFHGYNGDKVCKKVTIFLSNLEVLNKSMFLWILMNINDQTHQIIFVVDGDSFEGAVE